MYIHKILAKYLRVIVRPSNRALVVDHRRRLFRTAFDYGECLLHYVDMDSGTADYSVEELCKTVNRHEPEYIILNGTVHFLNDKIGR